jgi:23S rRNA-/tRNA-specific pseudouridylate synthase
MPVERLQKIMAAAGVASRRKAEEIIAAGRVTVNGAVVSEQGTKADPEIDKIKIDGKPLKPAEQLLYFMLHKPKGYVTTVSDPQGRPTVMQFVSYRKERLYPVGRLDYASEGLLLTFPKPITSKSAAVPTKRESNAFAAASPSPSKTASESRLPRQKFACSKTPPIPGTKSS